MYDVCGVWWCVVRFDFYPRQYVAGILEEDDQSHDVIGRRMPAGSGRSFTLYLYDREKHHVSLCLGCRWAGWCVAGA